MTPMVTWTRPTKLPPTSFRRRKTVESVISSGTVGYTGQGVATQSTTSFRTRGDQSHLDIPDTPLELLRKATQDQQEKNLALSSPVSNPRGFAGRDTGHPFSSVKSTIVLSHPKATIVGSGNGFYEGPLRLPQSSQFPVIPPVDITYGTKAIAATLPTKSVADISNDVAELWREGFPHATIFSLKDSTSHFRSLGKDYLNYEFGWKPFVKGIEKLLYAVVNSEAIIQQYARDSGRIVRRQYSFPAVTSTTLVSNETGWRLNDIHPNFMPDIYLKNTGTSLAAGVGIRQVELIKYEKYWFSGAYSYYLAVGDSSFDKMRLYSQYAQKLLGLGITPEVLWNLTPWSWLVDWVANVGDVITNATALSSDGLVIRWGYLMRHAVYTNRTTLTGLRFYRGPKSDPYSLYTRQSKERVKATPYGFGLDPDAFTLRQWAILAALGMTKAPKTLF